MLGQRHEFLFEQHSLLFERLFEVIAAEEEHFGFGGPFDQAWEFFGKFIEGAAGYGLGVAEVCFGELGGGEPGPVFEFELIDRESEEFGFLFFGFDQYRFEVFAGEQARNGGKAAAGADIGEPDSRGQIFEQRQRFENVACCEFLGGAWADEVEEFVMFLDQVVIIGKTFDCVASEFEVEFR